MAKKTKRKRYPRPQVEEGDFVLFRASTGKVWKICKVATTYSYNGKPEEYIDLNNARAKSYSRFRAWPKRGDIVFKIPNDTDIENADIKSLAILYAPDDINIADNKFFQPSKQYNIQINSRNKDKIKKLIELAKKEGIKFKKLHSGNVNIDAKYAIEEN